MAVAPASRRMRRTSVRMVTRRAASRLAKGSSRSTTDGAGARARARATRCCWPPDSSWGMRSPSPGRPASSSMASTRAARSGPPGQAEADVGRHRQVGEEGLLLGDDAHPAPLRGHVDAGPGHHPSPDGDAALVEALEAGHAAQERGLAAAGRAEHGGEGARLHRQVGPVEGGDGPERLAGAGDLDAEGEHAVHTPVARVVVARVVVARVVAARVVAAHVVACRPRRRDSSHVGTAAATTSRAEGTAASP